MDFLHYTCYDALELQRINNITTAVTAVKHRDIMSVSDLLVSSQSWYLTVNLSDFYLCACVSDWLTHWLTVDVSVCPYHFPNVWLTVCLTVFVCLSIYLSMCLSACLFVYLPVYVSINLSIYLSVCLCVYLFVDLSVCLSGSQSRHLSHCHISELTYCHDYHEGNESNHIFYFKEVG
jgi:hypothetical protein